MTNLSKDEIKYPEMDYFMNESLSDVVFVVNGQRLPALKLLLSIRSRVFRAMFSGKFKETEDKEVVIEETTYDAFESLIRFIYSDQLVLSKDYDFQLIEEVCKLSDRFEVFRLLDKVDDLLKSRVTYQCLTSCGRLAFKYNLKELKTKVTKFVDTNFCYLVNRKLEELIEINDATNNRLLFVMRSKLVQSEALPALKIDSEDDYWDNMPITWAGAHT